MASSYISIPAFRTTATANGSTRGSIVVTDVSGFFVGAKGWIKSDAVAPMYVQVVKIDETSKTLWLRQAPIPTGGAQPYAQPNYGYTNISAYTLAANTVVSIPVQVVHVWDQYIKPLDQS